MSEVDKSVQRVCDAYAAAVWARDAEALMRLYSPAVRVFDAWGVWSHEGAAVWRVAVEGWFTSLGSERVKVRFDDVASTAGREWATLSAIVTYAAMSSNGEELRQMQNRLTWVLQVSGHVLRIVHEHTSAPIDFDEATAILRRDRAA